MATIMFMDGFDMYCNAAAIEKKTIRALDFSDSAGRPRPRNDLEYESYSKLYRGLPKPPNSLSVLMKRWNKEEEAEHGHVNP
jgi:hypothetical protein